MPAENGAAMRPMREVVFGTCAEMSAQEEEAVLQFVRESADGEEFSERVWSRIIEEEAPEGADPWEHAQAQHDEFKKSPAWQRYERTQARLAKREQQRRADAQACGCHDCLLYLAHVPLGTEAVWAYDAGMCTCEQVCQPEKERLAALRASVPSAEELLAALDGFGCMAPAPACTCDDQPEPCSCGCDCASCSGCTCNAHAITERRI